MVDTLPRLTVEAIDVSYGAETVINALDVAFRPGHVTIIVGPNGCGKSTLLKAIGRVLRPTAGAVCLDGASVHGMPTKAVAKRIALLPQGPVAPEGLTVRELVAQGRFPHQSLMKQWSRDDMRAVDDAMAAADVSAFADRRVSDLSGGQRQRCWIAMVLAQETDILLLDEPTTFLDLKVQVDLMNLLRRIAYEAGRMLVVVMHELNVAATFADHLIMMKAGAILAEGPVDQVFTSSNLASVFDLDAVVIHEPESGRPVCIPRVEASGSMALAAQ